MSEYKKSIILFILITVSVSIFSCKENDNKMQFSFKQIQDLYYQEIDKVHAKTLSPFYTLCPFYIDEKFFTKVEQQLNELIAESDNCSVRICINIDNGILDVAALYNLKSKMYFAIWKPDGTQKQTKVHNPDVKRILKTKPKDLVSIEDSKHLGLDCTSTYIIKKIGKEIYYYAYYDEPYDVNYKPLIDLFSKSMNQIDHNGQKISLLTARDGWGK